MNTINKTSIIIAFTIAVVLFILFGGGAITGTMTNNEIIGNGMSAGVYWMWIPAMFTLGVVSLLGWVIFKKKRITK
ncbi:MAG: hypothetical protein ACYCVH_11560 [Ignavibacteriaceae bacterium]